MNCLLSQAIRKAPSHCGLTSRRFLSTTSKIDQEFRDSEDLAKERYDMRANEDVEKKRARLLYQSRKRGMLENGVILASFADKYLEKFNPEQLDIYDRLINLPTNDWDIFHWATNTKPTPAEFETTVMKDLREHIKRKVSRSSSNEDNGDDDSKKGQGKITKLENSVLGKTRPDDIVLPAVKKEYPLDIDPSQVSLVDYEEELFDNRIKRFANKEYIVRMTDWRKKYYVKRLRRTISSPVSLRHLSDDKLPMAYTQSLNKEKTIANENIVPSNLIESPKERALKHHNFLQHLLQSEFTDDVRDYDDEAEAWSEIMWRRNYGFSDVRVSPIETKCTSCNAKLHCCEPGLDGYLPKELFAAISTDIGALCQRCKFSQTYNAFLGKEVSKETYQNVLHELKKSEGSIICLLVDLTDFPSGLFENLIGLIGDQHRVLIVGNKLDLLPIDGSHLFTRIKYSLRKSLFKLRPDNSNLLINDVILLSARTGFGIESLVTRLLALTETPKNIYLLGCNNSGKSTLFNALVQTDLSAIREGDIISRVSIFKSMGEVELNLLKFPIARLEGWQVELKKKKSERVERNEAQLEKTFVEAVNFRQANTYHTSNLIDRFEYKSLSSEDTQLNFSADHPLKIHEDKFKRPPLSATEAGTFFHQTPSINSGEQLHDLFTIEERLEVYPNETIVPRNYSLRPLQSIFIAGLGRLDLLTSTSSVIFTIFASRYLPIHVVPTKKADKFYYTFLGSKYLGVPFGDVQRLKEWPQLKSSDRNFHIKGSDWRQGALDIVLGSLGWAMVRIGPDQECIVKAFTPEGRGISHRAPPCCATASACWKEATRHTSFQAQRRFCIYSVMPINLVESKLMCPTFIKTIQFVWQPFRSYRSLSLSLNLPWRSLVARTELVCGFHSAIFCGPPP